MRCAAIVLTTLALHLALVPVAMAADVTVFAAASLKEALDEQARQFEAATGNKVVVSYAREQRVGEADRSRRAGRHLHFGRPRLDGLRRPAQPARAEHPRQPAAQHARADRAGVEQVDPQDRAELRSCRRAGHRRSLPWPIPTACRPANTARARSKQLGVWTSVEKKVARAENVRAALALVSRGEAPVRHRLFAPTHCPTRA